MRYHNFRFKDFLKRDEKAIIVSAEIKGPSFICRNSVICHCSILQICFVNRQVSHALIFVFIPLGCRR